jgi:hypothetical protein
MKGKARSRLKLGVLLAGLILVALGLAILGSCQGLPSNVANCKVTPTPPTNTSVAPPATEPPAAALCGFPLTISSPGSGASVDSPVPIVASAAPPDPIYIVRVYVDGQAVLYSPNSAIHAFLWMPNGQPTVEMVAEDVAGYVATSTLQVNVVAQDIGATNIQNRKNWVSCSAVIVTATCASGLGVAQSTLTQHESSPSLDGSAAKFSLGGKTGYSNELYWVPLEAATASATSPTTFGFMWITGTPRSLWSLTSTRPSGGALDLGKSVRLQSEPCLEHLGPAKSRGN